MLLFLVHFTNFQLFRTLFCLVFKCNRYSMDQSVFPTTLTFNHILCCMLKRAVVFPPFGKCGFQFHINIFNSWFVQLITRPLLSHDTEQHWITAMLLSGIWNVTHQDINHTHQPNNCKCSVPWCMVLCEILLVSVFDLPSSLQGNIKQNYK